MNELKHLPEFISKMEQAGLPPVVVNTFAHYYRNIVSGDSGMICELDIEPVAPDQIESAENLSGYAADGHRAFPSAVRLILNGGLGTSMGLTGAKSLLKVKDGRSFLEIIVRQVRHAGITLAIMNSFRPAGPRRRSFCSSCKICARGCEPKAIGADGSIDPRECLSCMECEALYRDEETCPPLVGASRLMAKANRSAKDEERLLKLKADRERV